MDWIPSLLKHLGLSRVVVGAIFLAALTLYLGPRLAPEHVDAVPKEWSFAVVGTLVFSGAILFFWTVSSLSKWLGGLWKQLASSFAARTINQEEVNLLFAMGKKPRESLNLERVNYDAVGLSELEVLELVHGLERKGLVSISLYEPEIVSLTSAGRKRALTIKEGSPE